jgi:hypothetical protein
MTHSLGWVARVIAHAIRNPRLFVGRFRYVFILGHMRGYTSLLAHILGSHPEVSGYFELHQDYRGPLDLLRMRLRVAMGLEDRLRGPFVLDKILHAHHRIDASLLARENVLTIFMLRRPRETLRSCMGLPRFASNPSAAGRYYVERLESLARASTTPRHRAYLDAETLLERPETVLESLRSYLGLRQALSPTYSTFKYTGLAGYGDWSAYIKRGVIVRERDDEHVVEVPAAVLREAEDAFSAAQRTLTQHCRTLG